MSEVPESWFDKAEGNLRRATASYKDEEYWDAISQLQQANEKIAKGLLFKTGMLPTSREQRNLMASFFGVKKTRPEDLGHAWGENLLDDFVPFLSSFEQITKALKAGKSEPSRSAADWWKDAIPDYKAKLEAARATKENPLASLNELDATIKDCNKAIDLALALPSTLNLPEPKPPSSEDIAASLDKGLRAFGIKLDKKTLKDAEATARSRTPGFVKDFNGVFLKSAQFSYLLVSLMVLNVHLQKHHTLANYPTKRVVYDKKLPLVARFAELHALLQRCLDFGRSL